MLHVSHTLGSEYIHSISTAQDGRTPLIRAAMGGYTDIVQELMKHGASVNAQDGVSQRLHVLYAYSHFLMEYVIGTNVCTCAVMSYTVLEGSIVVHCILPLYMSFVIQVSS